MHKFTGFRVVLWTIGVLVDLVTIDLPLISFTPYTLNGLLGIVATACTLMSMLGSWILWLSPSTVSLRVWQVSTILALLCVIPGFFILLPYHL